MTKVDGRHCPASLGPLSGIDRNDCPPSPESAVRAQHAHLKAMMRGHYAYYGMSGNYRRLSWYALAVARTWRKWLSRCDRQGSMYWRRFAELLRRYPLPAARIVHCYTGTLL
jgi:hypothetical protein